MKLAGTLEDKGHIPERMPVRTADIPGPDIPPDIDRRQLFGPPAKRVVTPQGRSQRGHQDIPAGSFIHNTILGK
jgi:hypothetical protein